MGVWWSMGATLTHLPPALRGPVDNFDQNTWNISPDRTPNKSGQRSERLLKICIEFDAKAESLLAFNYLAAEFNKEHIQPG